MLRREPATRSLSDSDVESSTDVWVSGVRDSASRTSEMRSPE